MATTHQRLRKILDVAIQEDSWESRLGLASEVRQRRLRAFRMRGDGTTIDHYMRAATIGQLVDLLVSFGILDEQTDGALSVSSKGATASRDDGSFDRRIKTDVKAYLARNNCPLTEVAAAVGKIRLPDVPDIGTIYDNLPESGRSLSEAQLRRLLFLHACAGGINRKTRVHYEV